MIEDFNKYILSLPNNLKEEEQEMLLYEMFKL